MTTSGAPDDKMTVTVERESTHRLMEVRCTQCSVYLGSVQQMTGRVNFYCHKCKTDMVISVFPAKLTT